MTKKSKIGRPAKAKKEKKTQHSIRLYDEQIKWLEQFGGSIQGGIDYLIEKGKHQAQEYLRGMLK